MGIVDGGRNPDNVKKDIDMPDVVHSWNFSWMCHGLKFWEGVIYFGFGCFFVLLQNYYDVLPIVVHGSSDFGIWQYFLYSQMLQSGCGNVQ